MSTGLFGELLWDLHLSFVDCQGMARPIVVVPECSWRVFQSHGKMAGWKWKFFDVRRSALCMWIGSRMTCAIQRSLVYITMPASYRVYANFKDSAQSYLKIVSFSSGFLWYRLRSFETIFFLKLYQINPDKKHLWRLWKLTWAKDFLTRFFGSESLP